MTEPTAEQVNAERERAHVVGRQAVGGEIKCTATDHEEECDIVATALARVRIEARAAGRDEGLEAAARIADEHLTSGDGVVAERIGDAIRALRGRT